MQAEASKDAGWIEVCRVDDILPDTGVTCLVGTRQVALFRVMPDDTLYAIDAYDPFCDAHVLGRGIVGCHAGRPKVVSPMYKQSFELESGVCIDDRSVRLETFLVRKEQGKVQIRAAATCRLQARNPALLREGRA